MSIAFEFGFKVGSLLRNIFTQKEMKKRVDPTFLSEKQVSELALLKQDKCEDLLNERAYVECEIKTTINYQKVFLDQLISAYISNHPEDSVEEMPQDIVKIFQAMSGNNRYLDEMLIKIENIDLEKYEVMGFPEVKKVLNKIKKEPIHA